MARKKTDKTNPFIVGTFIIALFSFVLISVQALVTIQTLDNQQTQAYRGKGRQVINRPDNTPPGQNRRSPNPGIFCTEEYNPVCGEDGNTYPNECYAQRDNVVVACSGTCPCGDDQDDQGGNLRLGEPEVYPVPDLEQTDQPQL